MRLIDADALLKTLSVEASKYEYNKYDEWLNGIFLGLDKAIDKVEDAPTVDAVPVVHGRWEDVKETSLYVPDMKYTVTHTAETCSACKVRIGFIGSKPYLYDNICPNCGARMDGGNEHG